MSLIYRITCTANDKFYIGSTVNVVQRWGRHRRELRQGVHVNKNMQASWNKHGEGSFVFEVVEYVENVAELLLVEQKWLDPVVGSDSCFNWALYAGAPFRGKSGLGTPNYGKKFSVATRAKISAATSGPNHPNWGKPLRPETRAKIKEANKNNPWKGAKHTPESLAKIAAASRGRPCSVETRAKRSVASKGHVVSSVTRLQISRTLSGEGNFWYGKKRPESFCAKVRVPVVAVSPDGVETEYESIKALMEALSLKPPTVNRALKSGRPLTAGPRRGWSFSYKETT